MTGQKSITRETLIKMGIRIALVIITTTAISYIHLMSTLREQLVEQLEKYIIEHGLRESSIFIQANDNLKSLGKETLYQIDLADDSDPVQEFNRLFARSPDGVIRNRPEVFDGRRQTGVYIDKALPITPRLRRWSVIFYNLAMQFGAAWHNRFDNTYIDTPENTMAVYWPSYPTFAQDADTNYYMPDEEYLYNLTPENNPEREVKWTGMFFDPVSESWMVSVGYPVYQGDKHIANIGHDILLKSLMARTIDEHLIGAHNIIFREDGRLIVHPEKMKEIKEKEGLFDINKSDDSHLRRIFKLVSGKPPDTHILRNEEDDEYLAVTKIAGPNWFFVTIYPDALLAERAFETARFILLLGLLSLLIEVIILYFVMRRQIAEPLGELIKATDQIAMENFDIHLDTKRQDELGRLASSFSTMALVVQSRQEKLKAAHHSLEQANQLKDEFLANTSHELRTPLNGIIGIAESLMDGITGPLPKKTNFNLSLIITSGRRLFGLVNDLLDFSKLRNKELVLSLHPIGLREIVEVVLTLSRPMISDGKIELINDIPANLPAVLSDENRLQQILLNLVGNAIKFTEEGTVLVGAKENHSKFIEIYIQDTGIGIPVDQQTRIFESFEQADGDTARKYGGTGLGLSITKKLVELHGGKIWVESKPNSGSVFTFTLPSTMESPKESEQNSLRTQLAHILPGNDLVEYAPQNTIGNFTILCVDDEPVNRQVLINLLSLKSYNIISANSGKEALRIIAEQGKPNLLLLDVMMPGMTGFEVMNKLRRKYSVSELPIILLTAKNQVADLLQGFTCGANDYLTKPFSRQELLARIDSHLQLSKFSIELAQANFRLDLLLRGVQLLTEVPNKIWALLEAGNTILREVEVEHSSEVILYIFDETSGLFRKYSFAVLCSYETHSTIDLNIRTDKSFELVAEIPNLKSQLDDSNSDGLSACNFNNNTLEVPVIPFWKKDRIPALIKITGIASENFRKETVRFIESLSHSLSVVFEKLSITQRLEEQVEERTKKLKAAQSHLIQAEKMASLGQLISGIAHEINTPMGVIKASISNIADSAKKNINEFEDMLQEIPVKQVQLFTSLLQSSLDFTQQLTTREERKYKREMARRLKEQKLEKPEALAEMLIKIGIFEYPQKYVELLRLPNAYRVIQLAFSMVRQYRNSLNMQSAVERMIRTIFALKNFSTIQRDEKATLAEISEGIDTVLVLYHNQLKAGVIAEKDYEALPKILCYPNELIQVWTNVIHNGIQALKGKGKLTIATKHEEDWAVVSISDAGPGIPNEFLPKIFDPFFTTQPEGEGSGLGLHICKQIVEKHHGRIEVATQPGETTFSIYLPIKTAS